MNSSPAAILDGRDVDVVIQVADARNLRARADAHVQLSTFGRPMVLVLNMADEARAHGIVIDGRGLSARLGHPVVETVANRGPLARESARGDWPWRPCHSLTHRTAAITRASLTDLAVQYRQHRRAIDRTYPGAHRAARA